ncbi:MAG: hypothetical protein JKY89_05350 [Immundisolibacteraceae bacterium]|nr:hypothetical protein [Immundisolibacteraceae bacterium]
MKLDKETLSRLNSALEKKGSSQTKTIEEVFKDLIVSKKEDLTDLPPPKMPE